MSVIDIALKEVGYLEKKSINSDLYDKTKDAGDGNYTKYWQDLNPKMQGQPWCLCFVDWCFDREYGSTEAKKMLEMSNGYVYSCSEATKRFKKANKVVKDPQAGDIIFFTVGHTGIVKEVKNGKVYTIEGNTNNDTTRVVPNGGAVCEKSYSVKSSSISCFARPYSTTTTTKSEYPTLTVNSKGDWVIKLHKRLKELKYGVSATNDTYNQLTKACVTHYQIANKLLVDGIAGEQTLKHMGL